jgi:hypothetical protein
VGWRRTGAAHYSSHSTVALARVRVTSSILGGQLYTTRDKQGRRRLGLSSVVG